MPTSSPPLKVFKTVMQGNPKSFQQVYEMNKTSDVSKCYAIAKKKAEDVGATIGLYLK